MLWMILIALTAIWVIGSIAVTSFTDAAVILFAVALAVLAIQYWQRQHHT